MTDSKDDAALDAAETSSETKTKFVVLGVSRRDLLFLLASEDQAEAEQVAQDGVLQSRFSDTFVFPVTAHFSEAQVNWANPDGVKHTPAQGAQLNPGVKEQEPLPRDKSSDLPETSKRGNIEAAAQAQIESGAAIDTGQPDRNLANKDGKTSAFDSGDGREGKTEGDGTSPGSTAKGGVQSSSDLKGTSAKPSDDKK